MVNTTQKILCLLLGTEMSVNNLIAQTSSDKSHVVDVISNLGKLGLLEESKDKRHKQKKIKKLTSVGKEISILLTLISEYSDAERSLTRKIESFTLKEDISDGSKRLQLRDIGWSDDEITFNPKYVHNSHTIKFHFKRIMYELILYRYSLVMLRYKPKKKLKQFLHEIILSILTQQISEIIAYIEDIGPHFITTIKTRERIENAVRRWSNKFIQKEVKQLESQLLMLLEVSDSIKLESAEYLKDIIGTLEGKLRSSKENELRALSYFVDNFDYDPMSSERG